MKGILSLAWLLLLSFSISMGILPLIALLVYSQHLTTYGMFWVLVLGIPVSLGGGFLLLMAFAFVYTKLLPPTPSGVFTAFRGRASLLWALNNALPTLYLKWFKPTLFLNDHLRYVMLKALGANVQFSSWVTSNVVLSDLKNIYLGKDVIIGENVTLAPSSQPRHGHLMVGNIYVGDHTMVGGQSSLLGEVVIGEHTVLQADVGVCPYSRIGDHCVIGAGTRIDVHCRIGNHVRIGKWCTLLEGAQIDDFALIPDGSTVSGRVMATVSPHQRKKPIKEPIP